MIETPQIASQSRYVVGFMFDGAFQHVALIRKRKPTWQAGLLNGIGGKIEEGELPAEAMPREFLEEAGRTGNPWSHFASLTGTNNDGGKFALECFWSEGNVDALESQEEEKIEVIDIDTLSHRSDTIGNLPWLILLARDFGIGVAPPRIVKAEYGPSVSEATESESASRASSNNPADF